MPLRVVLASKNAGKLRELRALLADHAPPVELVDDVDWDDVERDSKARCLITGFSVSPEDVVVQGESLTRLCKTTGKDVSAECLEIVKGVDTVKAVVTWLDSNDVQAVFQNS